MNFRYDFGNIKTPSRALQYDKPCRIPLLPTFFIYNLCKLLKNNPKTNTLLLVFFQFSILIGKIDSVNKIS